MEGEGGSSTRLPLLSAVGDGDGECGDARSSPRGAPGAPQGRVCGVRTGRFNVLLVSASFFFLFGAYNTIQNFVTTLVAGHLGAYSLAVLYASVCVALLFAPAVVVRLGERRTLLLGAACYAVYQASLVHVEPAVVLAAAVVIGCGAAVLWVALGLFLSANSSEEDRGFNNGLFWSLFQLSGVAGNLLAYFVLNGTEGDHGARNGHWQFFAAFAVISVVGTLLLLPLRKPPPGIGAATAVESTAARGFVAEAKEIASRSCALLRDAQSLWLVPMFAFTGFELAFCSGEFPQLLPKEEIGLVLTALGVGEALGGVSGGWLSDRVGRAAVMLLGAAAYAGGLVGVVALKQDPAQFAQVHGVPWIAYLIALAFGLADSTFNTQSYAVIGEVRRRSHADRAIQPRASRRRANPHLPRAWTATRCGPTSSRRRWRASLCSSWRRTRRLPWASTTRWRCRCTARGAH